MNDQQFVKQHYPSARLDKYAGDFYVVMAGNKFLSSARADTDAWTKARREVEKQVAE